MNLCVHESMCNNSGIRPTYNLNVIRLYYYSESRINVFEISYITDIFPMNVRENFLDAPNGPDKLDSFMKT